MSTIGARWGAPDITPAWHRRAQLAAIGLVLFWSVIALGLFLGEDQINYQAAGERLNAGHALYSLMAGDRPVALNPPFWSVPLLYPPLIAVLWRAIVLVPLGPALWWFANAAAILVATGYILRRSPLLVAVASVGIGITIASGNVGGLLVAGTVAAWRCRDDPRVGALVAVMAAVKVVPAVMLIWLLATRRWMALAWAAVAGLICLAVGMLAGSMTLLDYIGIARSSAPEPLSLAGLTGLSPYVLAVIGVVVTFALPDRWSYRAATLAMLAASPASGVASLAALLPLAATGSGPLYSLDEAPLMAVSRGRTLRRRRRSVDGER